MSVQQNRELVKYDAMIINGPEDEEFVDHMVERLEKIGLKIFYPPRDVRVGMMEHVDQSDVIAKRCKKVIAVLSQNFCKNYQNMFNLDLAVQVLIRNKKEFLLPVLYSHSEEQITNLPFSVSGLKKLRYRPDRKIVNFWVKLVESFEGTFKLTEELKKMDFPGPKG